MKLVVNEQIRKTFEKHKVHFHYRGEQRLNIGNTLNVEADCCIEPYTSFNAGFNLHSMGAFSYSNSVLPLPFIVKLRIGRYCSIAEGLKVQGVNHPIDRFSTSSITYDKDSIIVAQALKDHVSDLYRVAENKDSAIRDVTIGNDVWIGADVTLARGITIGDGAIIGSNALVTKDVPPFAIVGGVPAKIIRMRFSEDVISDLLDLQWWKYGFWDFGDIDVDGHIKQFIERISKKVYGNELKPFKPDPFTIDLCSLYEEKVLAGNYLAVTTADLLSDKQVSECRDLAISFENQDINIAYHLMKAAHHARPNGPLIKRKLDSYLIQITKHLR